MPSFKLLALIIPLVSLTTRVAGQASTSTSADRVSKFGKCTESLIPVSINATNVILDFDTPKDQQVVTDLILRWTTDPEGTLGGIIKGNVDNNNTYRINALFCVPEEQDERGTVELAVHGVGFDHTYWTVGGSGSKYNYVEAALKAGHAILAYDRLGTGKSDKPDGLKEVQGPTQVEVAAQLARYLQGKPQGKTFGRFLGIGHSFGSITLVAALSKYGDELFNATVITGITPDTQTFLPRLATQSLSIAAENNPKRFGELTLTFCPVLLILCIGLGALPREYLVWNSIINNQQNFFAYPNYDPAILKDTEAGKWSATIGEFLTAGGSPALNYTNPVIVVTGEKDYVACGANCLTKANGTNLNLVEATKSLFPATRNYSTYIPLNTGHGLTAHLSAPETHAVIQKWIADLL
ncbi:hypothetical protein FA13DRAFT_1639058 [Coprinellus micaceus]|uniref:AB hydrolase-1 domain-containing protein n=1 Tax=Coprinellus micaceus TaxID=71717 RepID=A0A4Y7SQE5_COPMI|nr:hypothetical protein FA13DRAFT_1639058 [Coprinellus micaceus]